MTAAAPALLTVAEAGRALGVSSSTVWRLIRRGALPSVRAAGRRLVPERAVLAPVPERRDAVAPLTPAHPIFALVGAGRGGGRKPGARDKHAIVERRR